MKSFSRFLLAAIFLWPYLLPAQTRRELKGSVTDESNAPLSGVSVTVKGTRKTVVTNAQGQFTITVSGPDAILEISYVGYTSVEIRAGDERTFSVSLHSGGGQLNDVVVTGYGLSAKKDITGAVTSLPAEDFNVGVISTPGELLAGKVAGINVTKSGDPNEQPVVILRGASTLRTGAAQQPLYVIDGVPDASIDLVAPSDIATIDVLKDASATAIYGARAANGVIMITTRKPKAGQTRLAYNAYVAADVVSKRIDMLSAPQLRQYLIDQGAPLVGGHANGNYDDSVNNNWQDAVQRTGVSQNHNIYFGGNTGSTIFGGSVNYFNTQGIMKASSLQRTTIRAAIEHHLFNDRLRLGLNVMDASSDANQIPTQVFGSMLTYMPTLRAIEPGGAYSTEYPYGGLNPVSLINNNSDGSKAKTFLANARAEVNILAGLKYTLSLTTQTQDTTTEIYYNTQSELARGLNGEATSTTTESTKKVVESFFNYDKSFGEHSIRLLGGYSWEEDRLGEGFGVTTQNFPNDDLGANNLAVSSPPANTVTFVNTNIGVLRLISYYARVNYLFSEKYLFQASIRDDGSSAFGANHRWGYFPAVSAGWRISKESFMTSTARWLDDLKLRIGYGVTGNSLGFDPLIAQEQFGIVGRSYTNGSYLDAIGPVQNANPDLRWESTATTNAGADFSLLKGFLSGSLDFYSKITTNLIWSYPVSATQFPVTTLTTNIGKISNKGVELQLNASLIKTRDFSWKSSFNLAHNANDVISISNSQFNNQYVYTAYLGGKGQTDNWSQIIEPGHPIGTFDIWHYRGKNAQGISVFQSTQGDTTSSPTTADFFISGNAQPQLLMGWSNTFTYKGFDLNFFFRAVTGNKILNATLASLNDPIDAKTQNLPVWSIHESYNDINSTYISDRFLEKGDYLRLDNATLGYTFPIHSKSVNRLRAYVSANNLFVVTGYRGVDPEITIGGLTPGIDNNDFYPKTRSFQFGINAIF
jgi:TonB-linked SusC/RagA family outer membrane protein